MGVTFRLESSHCAASRHLQRSSAPELKSSVIKRPSFASTLPTGGRQRVSVRYFVPSAKGNRARVRVPKFVSLLADSKKEVPASEVDRDQCPCSSGKKFAECCEPHLTGQAAAPTPEALMRSRFSAYVKNVPQYVMDTTHPDSPHAGGSRNADGTPSSTLLQDAAATCRAIAFLRLAVGEAAAPAPDATEAWVSFQAWFQIIGQVGQRGKSAREQCMSERSRFLRDATGRWLYHSGEVSYDGQPHVTW